MGLPWRWRGGGRLVRVSWGRLVVLLVLLLASLQVLHMTLLNRLEARNSHAEEARTLRKLQDDSAQLYYAMHDTMETTQVVDSSGQYKIINFLYDPDKGGQSKQKKFNHKLKKIVKNDVTLVSQCTVNHLHHVVELSERWQGPISVSIFAPDKQSLVAIEMISYLYMCVPSVRTKLSFHLVYPLTQGPETSSLFPHDKNGRTRLHHAQNAATCSDLSQVLQDKVSMAKNYALAGVKYPNNLLRNVARSNCRTEYVFVIDIDMLPSANLHRQFEDFTQWFGLDGEGNTQVLDADMVFVVPAFEILPNVPIPQDKASLLRDWQQRNVRPFYHELCWKCQRHTDYESWRNLTGHDGLRIGYEVEWKDPWEPFYIGPKDMPPYDERFKQYGFNRISQVCELHIAGFQFSVLDSAFLVHRGFKRQDGFHVTKELEQDENRLLFRQFKDELKTKYPDSDRRCY